MLKFVVLLTLLSCLASCDKQTDALQLVDCQDLIRGCDIGTGKLFFNQLPKPLAPFIVTLKTSTTHITIGSVTAQFNMQDMQMGFNNYQFISVKSGVWQANVTLPVCMQGRGDWLMILEVNIGGKTKRLGIPFKAVT